MYTGATGRCPGYLAPMENDRPLCGFVVLVGGAAAIASQSWIVIVLVGIGLAIIFGMIRYVLHGHDRKAADLIGQIQRLETRYQEFQAELEASGITRR